MNLGGGAVPHSTPQLIRPTQDLREVIHTEMISLNILIYKDKLAARILYFKTLYLQVD